MSPFIKLLLGLAAFVVAAFGGVVLTGALLPREHQARRTGRFRRPPKAVWDAIHDVDAYPEWRSDVEKVDRLPNSGGRPRWREHSRGQQISYEIFDAKPNSKLVTRIIDEKLPFGGRWTFVLEPTSDGCTLTIVEDGEVKNPLFRFMSRFVYGHSATIDAYFEALGKKLGGLSE